MSDTTPAPPSTAALYDAAAADWRRDAPVLLSDYTARPMLLDWCEPLGGSRVLDLGCGEGYVARQLASRGAGEVLGVDVSAEMVAQARAAEAELPRGARFEVADAAHWDGFTAGGFDLAVAVFLFNYLSLDDTRAVIRNVRRALRPGGRFVFSVPHPALPFLDLGGRAADSFHFTPPDGAGYFGARDRQLEGRIARRDGRSVPVRCVHKTFEDFFTALRDGGFTTMPEIRELRVTAEHLALDPEFFAPLADRPLHVAFRVEARP